MKSTVRDFALSDNAAVIRKRVSVRNYAARPVSEEDYETITQYLAEASRLTGPFGGTTRVELVKVTGAVSEKGIKLGTYGMIKNPQAYLVGVIPKDDKLALLDFGYAFEKLILLLTDMGIGTCWMGGTFNRNSFGREINLSDKETIPCVTPIGYPQGKEGLLRSAMRTLVKADNKKGWSELFCDGAFGRPLEEKDAGRFAVPIEMVRLGPSASNKQPWRLVLAEDRSAAHLYLAHTPNYSEVMQRTDMGIAMSHFELGCRAAGVDGGWVQRDPGLPLPDDRTEYMASWIAKA
ncbi:MAG: nitroreductase [Paenibacillaceae bacterium]|jgi:nitroreductase|nr:nitroreductase [Paenibacillaceae bacterium]